MQNYTALPEDWYLIISDIKGSTKAIEAGRYKDVNFVGAMSIVAILNLAKEIEIPFVFGGDGATLFIPASLYDKASLALNNVRTIVKNNFELELRIAILKVDEIYKAGHKLFITKQQVSPNYTQAIIRGGGVEYADALIKREYAKYMLQEIETPEDMADFSSLECRWQEIPSPKEEVLTLLVRAKEDTHYTELFRELDRIFGDLEQRTPIKEKSLHLSFSPKNLRVEASLYSSKFYLKALHIFSMMFINGVGALLMALKIGLWGSYKRRVEESCDTQKFDDMFRTVISATKEERVALEKYLKNEHLKGNLHYGIHKSNTSLMTCLVFSRHGKHVHFVDGSQGGYAVAAKAMKTQLNPTK